MEANDVLNAYFLETLISRFAYGVICTDERLVTAPASKKNQFMLLLATRATILVA